MRSGSSIESSSDAGSEGVVPSEGENVRWRGSREGDSAASVMPNAFAVERLGVDFDWKPLGSDGPLLCGGIVDERCRRVEVGVEMMSAIAKRVNLSLIVPRF